MTVTFCGHREVADRDVVRKWLTAVLCELLQRGAEVFYLGGYGEFDRIAAAVLRELRIEYPSIQIMLILPYLNQNIDAEGYTSTLYPGLENVPPRYAISRRNRWMAEQADVVVAYVLHGWGGAATMLHCAEKKNKQVIQYSTRT